MLLIISIAAVCLNAGLLVGFLANTWPEIRLCWETNRRAIWVPALIVTTFACSIISIIWLVAICV